ncbi:MAG: ferritin family protein [Dehalococcoidia bacterium]|nr:ferritin family protein [Dehalococcoidia bacterium]
MAKRRMKAADALELAIEREKGAARFYSQAASRVKDANGKSMFRWLAKEESRHMAKLRQQLKSVTDSNRWIEWRRAHGPIRRDEFPSMSEATGEVKADAGELDALRQAIGSEKDAIGFYREAEESTPDLNGKAMFKALAREEEGHLELLEEEFKWLSQHRKYFTVHRFELRPR